MIVERGMEVSHCGTRAQVMEVRGRDGGAVEVDLFYLNGSYIGREITVRPGDLEPLGAVARPTFGRSDCLADASAR